MQQLLIGLVLVLGLGGYWLYNENQTLKENNFKFEAAVEDQQVAIFSRHNLDMLAIKKPGLIENRFRKGSIDVMESMENDTKELFDLNNPNPDN